MPKNTTKSETKGRPRPKAQSRWAPYMLALFAAVLAIGGSAITWIWQRPKPSIDESTTKISDRPHRYTFKTEIQTVTGMSNSPFEKGHGYYARVEACDSGGIESIFVVSECYITLKVTSNITISNSENITSAIYDDGHKAIVCCMRVLPEDSSPVYRVKLPPDAMKRRTYQRGTEIQIILTIPDADLDHELDAISFSTGDGTPPILFPARDRMYSMVMSQAEYNARKHEPAVQEWARRSWAMKLDLKAKEERSRGLTFAP